MLVLSRKPQESIWIGDDIEIVVTAIQGNRVRLGVRAPASVPVLRKELAEKTLKERSVALLRAQSDVAAASLT